MVSLLPEIPLDALGQHGGLRAPAGDRLPPSRGRAYCRRRSRRRRSRRRRSRRRRRGVAVRGRPAGTEDDGSVCRGRVLVRRGDAVLDGDRVGGHPGGDHRRRLRLRRAGRLRRRGPARDGAAVPPLRRVAALGAPRAGRRGRGPGTPLRLDRAGRPRPGRGGRARAQARPGRRRTGGGLASRGRDRRRLGHSGILRRGRPGRRHVPAAPGGRRPPSLEKRVSS